MISVGISDDALEDLDEGFWFYEAQLEGLGDYFSSCLRGDIEGLKVTGGIHRICYREFRRLLSRVFPYAIYYTIDDQRAVVWAVVDCHRDPAWIREHLDSRS
jgi:hypothetical protein